MPLAPGEPDKPGVATAPPILVLGPTLALLVFELLLPTSILPTPARWLVGGALVITAAALDITSYLAQRRAGTDPIPWHPSTTVVARGPYRYSRNPMYVGYLLLAAGASVLVDSWWGIVGLPLGAWLVTWGAISREERYLERKFGEAYVAYKRRVRRWI